MRILLVHGDEAFRSATRKAFWEAHRGWEVLLGGSLAEASGVLARDRVDALILDGQAGPDVDGFLEGLGQQQPAVVRILLAEAEEAARLESADPAAHRIFLKPVDPAFLVGVVESLDILDDDGSQRALQAFVGSLGRVPSLPSLYAELVDLLNREDAGMGEVARLVRKDPGIAAQVLKLANSVLYASSRPVSEIGQALAKLGVDTLRAVVLFRGVIDGCGSARPQGLDLETLWHHSFQVAAGARKLAVHEGATHLADVAFSVGLLHDLGLLVLATEPSGRYREVMDRALHSHIPLAVLEHQAFGVDHAQVGAHLLSLWGLPPAFCHPVREHHAPPLESAGFPLSAALHLSDAKHGGGEAAGVFADGRWGLHPTVLADPERLARWKACLSPEPA